MGISESRTFFGLIAIKNFPARCKVKKSFKASYRETMLMNEFFDLFNLIDIKFRIISVIGA